MNIRTYLIIAIGVLIAGLTVTVNIQMKQLKTLKAQSVRLEQNQQRLLDASESYLIRADLNEFRKIITPRIDSIIDELNVKPKNIERVVERYYYHTDSVIKVYQPKPVETPTGVVYPFIDTTQCFTFGGQIEVTDTVPELEVNRREYKNEAVDIYFRQRTKKFWFIRYGDWEYIRRTQNTCGDDVIKEIDIEKR